MPAAPDRRARRALLLRRFQLIRERAWTRELRELMLRHIGRCAELVASLGESGPEHQREDFSRDLADLLRRNYRISMYTMRDRVYSDIAQMSRKSAEEVFEQAVLSFIERQVALRVVTIASTFFGDIRSVVREGFVEGLGQEAVASRLRDRVGRDYAQWMAARIARTENHTASERGSYEAAASSDFDTVKEWSSAEDSRTRPAHHEADGQIREMSEPFLVGGEYLMHPGDPAGSPRQIINCRCVTLYHPRIAGEIIR